MDPWGAGQAAQVVELAAARRNPALAPMQIGLETPFAPDNHLNAVVWADLIGVDNDMVTRAGAMTIPALARQRHLLCGTVARCPLVQVRGAELVTDPDTTRWMTRGDGPLSPYHRMLWTIDDLLFTGWSLWRTTRGSQDMLLAADRVPTERWEVENITGHIKVDGDVVDARDVILIPGPHEGILNFGAPALRRTIDNLDAAANAARNPSAYLELHYTGDEPLTDDEIDALTARWTAARRGQTGGVAYTGKSIELHEHGTHEGHLLIEGRNADAVDVSRLVSSPAAMADATNAGASLTYETTNGRNQQFIDYGVGLYMDAVAARLGMDDVVARGTRVAYDTSVITVPVPPTTGAPTDD